MVPAVVAPLPAVMVPPPVTATVPVTLPGVATEPPASVPPLLIEIALVPVAEAVPEPELALVIAARVPALILVAPNNHWHR